jgi:hypothetical protein
MGETGLGDGLYVADAHDLEIIEQNYIISSIFTIFSINSE